jgi:hypothetical protein
MIDIGGFVASKPRGFSHRAHRNAGGVMASWKDNLKQKAFDLV